MLMGFGCAWLGVTAIAAKASCTYLNRTLSAVVQHLFVAGLQGQ